jgi:hypothetical protein
VTYGDDSGNRIFVLYWRCSLIRVSVIRGSIVLLKKSLVNFVSRVLNSDTPCFRLQQQILTT